MVSRMRRLRYAVKHGFWTLTNRWPRVRPEVLEPEDPQFYAKPSERGTGDFAYPERVSTGQADRLLSCLCTEAQLTSPAFRYWIGRLGETLRMHRKLWEFAYVIQALHERAMLAPGKRGLAFAVGQEPLPSLFASLGCHILATDLGASDYESKGWAKTGQHASAIDSLNRSGLCDPELFRQRVSYRPVDMNAIPDDLTGFDFTWSSCSFEHCGSIDLGKQFLWQQMRCLKPGGVAVHTTEFNLTSNHRTREKGNTVIFRRRDIEEIVRRLRDDGHDVEPLNLDVGSSESDLEFDRLPHSLDRHLKLEWRSYVTTSIGIIIRKSAAAASAPGDSTGAA